MSNAADLETDAGRVISNLRTSVQEFPGFTDRWEIDVSWKDMRLGLVGKVAELFPRFMYFRYEDWLTVASTPPYKYMHEALKQADASLAPKIVAQIKRKRLRDIYSMGPTPSVDKLLLEQLIRKGVEVTYHPVDTSQEAVASALEEVTQHLTATFGNSWERFVKLGTSKPMKFAEVKSATPSCVIYDGGNMMNNRKFWEQGRSIAGKGGIVIASAAVTPEPDSGSWADYWLSIYATPEGMKMFENALGAEFPDLFSKKNRDKWHVKFEYVPESWSWPERWGLYQTPMVSVQLHVKELMTLSITDPETRKPVNICVPQDERKGRPIVLITSTKLNLAAFLQTVPENFGLVPIGALEKERYVLRETDYELNGRRGLAVAAIFDVGTPPPYAVPSLDLGPKLPKQQRQ